MKIPPKHPAPEPGEWQTDENGRRFRKIGDSCIEYEPEINGIPKSKFFAYQKAQKEREAAEAERRKREAADKELLRRHCPIMDDNGKNADCSREKCALFMNGCALARLTGDRSPARDTKGLQCPFSTTKRACRIDCALYKGGCALTAAESENK